MHTPCTWVGTTGQHKSGGALPLHRALNGSGLPSILLPGTLGHPSLSSFISCHSLCPLQAAAHQVRPLAAFPLPLLLLRMLFLMPLWFHSEPICPWSESPGACKCMCYIKVVLPGEHSKGWGAGNGAGEEASKGQAGAGAWGWSTLGQGWRPQEMPGLTGR